MLEQLKIDLAQAGDPERARNLSRFFKTGPGEYGEGDKFRGIRVPVLRILSKKYRTLNFDQTVELLHSEWHEDRMTALFILTIQYQKGNESVRKNIVDTYLRNTEWINNWDLVDCSAHKILGHWLLNKNIDLLEKLADSKSLWERRIAVISTATFIWKQRYEVPLKICEKLIYDDQDLIHKAVGWMLREIGNKNKEAEIKFLKKYYSTMPRTALRYAIEKFPENERQKYLRGTI